MPPVEQYMGVPPERVWQILSDPPTYAYWVVGSRTIERWDPTWPAAGSKFHHTQGRWPVVIHDYTEVIAAEEPRHLELLAHARPMLDAKVIIDIRPEGGGCRVWLEEQPVSGVMKPLLKVPPWPQVTKLRNKESLKRIRQLAEGRKSD